MLIQDKKKWPFPTSVDSTMLHAYRSCPQQFYLSYIRRIRAAGTNTHFVCGGAFAKGLEVARRQYVQTTQLGVPAILAAEKAMEAGLLALITAYGDHEPSEKNKNKDWLNTAKAYVSYLDKWPLHSDYIKVSSFHEKPAVEFTFALELPVTNPTTGMPIFYAGRLDWIGEYNGLLLAMDEKTTRYFKSEWASDWVLRAQFTGYVYACRQYNIPAAGYGIRGTALKMTEIEHQEAIITIPEWRLQRWWLQTIRDVTRMVENWHQDYYDFNLGDACTSYNGCPFVQLCKVEEPETWIEAGDYVENTWSPLMKEGDA